MPSPPALCAAVRGEAFNVNVDAFLDDILFIVLERNVVVVAFGIFFAAIALAGLNVIIYIMCVLQQFDKSRTTLIA